MSGGGSFTSDQSVKHSTSTEQMVPTGRRARLTSIQGKGNSTKKKKEINFDFDKKMSDFMNKSKNNDMFEPLIKAANTASNISSAVSTFDNLGDTLKQNVIYSKCFFVR